MNTLRDQKTKRTIRAIGVNNESVIMATQVILRSVIKQPDGKVFVNFDNGSQREFTSIADLQAWARKPDTDVDLTEQLCIAWAVARSPELSNIATIQNKTFTFDLSAPNPIRVQ